MRCVERERRECSKKNERTTWRTSLVFCERNGRALCPFRSPLCHTVKWVLHIAPTCAPYAYQRCPRCAQNFVRAKSYASGTLFPFSSTTSRMMCSRSAFLALVDITKPPLLAICGRLTCSSKTAVSIFCAAAVFSISDHSDVHVGASLAMNSFSTRQPSRVVQKMCMTCFLLAPPPLCLLGVTFSHFC